MYRKTSLGPPSTPAAAVSALARGQITGPSDRPERALLRALKVSPTGSQNPVLTSLLRFRVPGWAMIVLGRRPAAAPEGELRRPHCGCVTTPVNGCLLSPKFFCRFTWVCVRITGTRTLWREERNCGWNNFRSRVRGPGIARSYGNQAREGWGPSDPSCGVCGQE